MCIVLFTIFVRCQQNYRHWETLRLCKGVDILNFDKKFTDLYCFTFHIGKLGALSWGLLSPPKPRGDWIGYHQTSISKTVLPNHVR